MAPTLQGKGFQVVEQTIERHAFDFLQVDWARTRKPFYQVSLPQYLLSGVPNIEGVFNHVSNTGCKGRNVY